MTFSRLVAGRWPVSVILHFNAKRLLGSGVLLLACAPR
jgi:hypothetical protein